MPSITYQGKLPPPGEFQKSLAEAMSTANPVDDLLELASRLWQFEKEHKLSSDAFYRGYQEGTLGDELQHCVEWAATYESFVKTKRKLESVLMRAVVQPEMLEPALARRRRGTRPGGGGWCGPARPSRPRTRHR